MLRPAHILAHYLVRAFVGVFDTRSPLTREDVYMGLLAKSFGVTPRSHRGFMRDSFMEDIFFRSSLIADKLKCIVTLFNYVLQQRFREIAYSEHTITNMKKH